MSALPDLDGKVAVVTGGASGIGRGIARQLTREGAKVVIADIEEGALKQAATELGATPVPTDVSDPASVQSLAKEVIAQFGTVHVVCNNAGIGPMALVSDLTLDDWRWMVGVNLWGVIHGIHTFLPILKDNPDGGHIVNTASMAGLDPPPRLGAYATCKFGVVGLTEVLAQELEAEGSKVGVSVLCPGTVRTNIGYSSRNRPAHLADIGLLDIDIELEDNPAYRWIMPDEAGAVAVRAIKNGALYALTHPDWYDRVAARHEKIAAAFRAQAEQGPPTPK